MTGSKSLEPGARKLLRLQAEIEALCSWSDARKAEGAQSGAKECKEVDEANRLSRNAE